MARRPVVSISLLVLIAAAVLLGCSPGNRPGDGGVAQVPVDEQQGDIPSEPLQITEALAISPASVTAGQPVQAAFKVKNVGKRPVTIECLVAAARLGDWSGAHADFSGITNVTLEPGQEVAYNSSRSFTAPGTYLVEPHAKIDGYWNIIPGGNRLSLAVISPGRLEITQALVLSPASPTTGQPVRATFKVKNVGQQPILIDCLVVAARLGTWSGASADFSGMTNVTLQPGEELAYASSRSFTTAGTYLLEPRAKVSGSWNTVRGAERLTLIVAKR